MFTVNKTSFPPRSLLFALVFLAGMTPAFVTTEAMAQGMGNMPGMGDAKQAAVKTGKGIGTVTALNASARKVTLDHAPIPSIPWPAMKMEFPVAQSVDLSKFKAGDKVEFTVSGSGNSFTVQSIDSAK